MAVGASFYKEAHHIWSLANTGHMMPFAFTDHAALPPKVVLSESQPLPIGFNGMFYRYGRVSKKMTCFSRVEGIDVVKLWTVEFDTQGNILP